MDDQASAPEWDQTLDLLALQLARLALREDLGSGDLTGGALLSASRRETAELKVKQDGVIAGLPWLRIVFQELDPDAELELLAADGDYLRAPCAAARITCHQQALAAGERTALNLLQHLSGIATLTRKFVTVVEGTKAAVLDTRKTTPGLRAFEKYAVRCGGGVNHRMGLYDEMMIKENHLRLGGVTLEEAVGRLREAHPGVLLTAEAESVAEAGAAVRAGADVVLLDELSLEEIRMVVDLRSRDERFMKTLLEVSGGVNLETARGFAETGVERISVGAITHSAPALDLSLKVVRQNRA